MAGKRKELFSAARNAQGDLVIYFPHSNIVITPSEDFWEGVIDEIEPYLANADEDEIAPQGAEKIFKEVRDIIQNCLKNW